MDAKEYVKLHEQAEEDTTFIFKTTVIEGSNMIQAIDDWIENI